MPNKMRAGVAAAMSVSWGTRPYGPELLYSQQSSRLTCAESVPQRGGGELTFSISIEMQGPREWGDGFIIEFTI